MEHSKLIEEFNRYKALNLGLNMQRGQPADDNFDLSKGLVNIVDENNLNSRDGISLVNYPGGVNGLPEARELFAEMLMVEPSEAQVGNNASLKMLSNLLMWSLLKGVNGSKKPWRDCNVKIIVTVPGYDRHFLLLETLGFEIISVGIDSNGPDMDKIEEIVANDPDVKGIVFVPTYSNPTGDSISLENAKRLVSLKAAAEDFTVFADEAYIVHHLVDNPKPIVPLLKLAKEVGNPNSVYVFSSTSKVTFPSGGIGIMATSEDNLTWYNKLLGAQSIGPNKLEQFRHVQFINNYPGGLKGLMKGHAKILKPKFDCCIDVLTEQLGESGSGLASWTKPEGGYFISLETSKPVAKRVIELASEAGVSLTPAGATYPKKDDPNNSNIRIAPTRPPLAEVKKAMEIVSLCIKIASRE